MSRFYDAENDVERILRDDSRTKKQAGVGVFKRATRTGKHVSVVTPTERLNKDSFDYKLATTPSVTVTYNFKEEMKVEMLQRVRNGEIPSMQEIDNLCEEAGFEKAQAVVAELRRFHKNEILLKAWGIYLNKLLKFVYDKYETTRTRSGMVLLGQEARDYVADKNPRGANKQKQKQQQQQQQQQQNKKIDLAPLAPLPKSKTPKIEVVNEVVKPVEVVTIAEESFLVNLKKRHNSKQLSKLFTHLSTFLEYDEEQEYEIEIKIK